jgi:exodeoxyribonuclease VII large subunit
MLSPNRHELTETFAGYELLLKRAINSQIQQRHLLLSRIGSHLRHPGNRLNEQRQRLDEMELRLTSAVSRHQQQAKYQLQLLLGRFYQQTPQQKIEQLALKYQNLAQRLQRQSMQNINDAKRDIAHLAQRLHTVSPLATLERGYAIVSHGKTIVRSSDEVKVGDTVQAKLRNGQLQCRVETIEK